MPPREPAAAAAARRRGLNENYARELMELHTLGVDGGYTQKDVRRSRARSPAGRSPTAPGWRLPFEPRMHDDGEKIVLGQRIKAGGNEGRRAGARHPRRASVDGALHRHEAGAPLRRRRSARPRSSSARRHASRAPTATSARSCGPSSRRRSSSPRSAYARKVKTPFEFVVSAVRATGTDVANAHAARAGAARSGHADLRRQPPTGYADKADAWVNTGALLNRMNFAVSLTSGQHARRAPAGARAGDPRRPIDSLGDGAGRRCHASTRQRSRRQRPRRRMALILGSPEFQREARSMISRRVFLKNGGLALVSLGFAPAVPRAHAAAAAARASADRDLPARRRRRPEHGRAVRRARLLRGPAEHRHRRARLGPGAASISTASSACIRAARRSSRSTTRGSWRSSTPAARPTRRARTSTRRTTWRRRLRA